MQEEFRLSGEAGEDLRKVAELKASLARNYRTTTLLKVAFYVKEMLRIPDARKPRNREVVHVLNRILKKFDVSGSRSQAVPSLLVSRQETLQEFRSNLKKVRGFCKVREATKVNIRRTQGLLIDLKDNLLMGLGGLIKADAEEIRRRKLEVFQLKGLNVRLGVLISRHDGLHKKIFLFQKNLPILSSNLMASVFISIRMEKEISSTFLSSPAASDSRDIHEAFEMCINNHITEVTSKLKMHKILCRKIMGQVSSSVNEINSESEKIIQLSENLLQETDKFFDNYVPPTGVSAVRRSSQCDKLNSMFPSAPTTEIKLKAKGGNPSVRRRTKKTGRKLDSSAF